MAKPKDPMSNAAPLITPKTVTRPPWALVLPDGELSPDYGPATKTEEYKLQREHRQSLAGGGLWDSDQTEKAVSKKKTQPAKTPEKDYDEMIAFIERHGHELPTRELEVILLVYPTGLRIRTAAKRLKISKNTVKAILKRVRIKMKELAERGPFEESL